MLRHCPPKAIFLALVLGFVCSVLPVAPTQAKQGKSGHPHADQAQKQQQQRQQRKMTAAQAAARAKAQYGGKVLKVTPSGKGYKVKLLTESGRVLTVGIQD